MRDIAAEKRRKAQREHRYNLREMAQSKKAAGLRGTVGRLDRDVIQARLAEIPDDTRDLTARTFGDPIPNDPRRPWLNGSR